jgi:hypothetical protein
MSCPQKVWNHKLTQCSCLPTPASGASGAVSTSAPPRLSPDIIFESPQAAALIARLEASERAAENRLVAISRVSAKAALGNLGLTSDDYRLTEAVSYEPGLIGGKKWSERIEMSFEILGGKKPVPCTMSVFLPHGWKDGDNVFAGPPRTVKGDRSLDSPADVLAVLKRR